MASQYGYITVANLQLFATIDYRVKTGNIITDEMIEAQISQAERFINVYCHQTFSGTIPDGVVAVSNELSRRLMHNRLKRKGFKGFKELPDEEVVIKNDEGLMHLLEEYVLTDLEGTDSIDIIPMTRNQFSPTLG